MADFIIKTDGTREPFNINKVKRDLLIATKRISLAPERTKEILNQVSEDVLRFTDLKEEVRTSEIREKILKELNIIEPVLAQSIIDYEKEIGKDRQFEE